MEEEEGSGTTEGLGVEGEGEWGEFGEDVVGKVVEPGRKNSEMGLTNTPRVPAVQAEDMAVSEI